jgi:hypothetical protein
MAPPRRFSWAVVAGLAAGAAAVAALALGGGGGDATVVAGPPGRGYAADPAAYLSDAQRREMARSGLPLLAPRWLPTWTQRAEFIAGDFTTGPEGRPLYPGWGMTWQVSWTTGDELTRQLNSDLSLDVDANASVESLAKRASGPSPPYRYPPCGDRIGLLNKPCIMEGKRRAYVFEEDGLDENLRCYVRDPGVEGVGSVAAVHFRVDGVTYSVTLGPGPGCSEGHFTVEDLLAVADSLEPVEG